MQAVARSSIGQSSSPTIPSSIPLTRTLADELALLDAVLARSRHQHATQLFLQRVKAVRRIGYRLLAVLDKDPSSTRRMRGTTEGPNPLITAGRLAELLQTALARAQRSANQQIELHHFLPLQATLLAINSRLYALSAAAEKHAHSTTTYPPLKAELGGDSTASILQKEDRGVIPVDLPIADMGVSISRPEATRIPRTIGTLTTTPPERDQAAILGENFGKAPSKTPIKMFSATPMSTGRNTNRPNDNDGPADRPLVRSVAKKAKRLRANAMDDIFG